MSTCDIFFQSLLCATGLSSDFIDLCAREAGVSLRQPRKIPIPALLAVLCEQSIRGVGFAISAPLTDGVGSVLDREVDELPGELIAFIFKNWQPFYQFVITNPKITEIQSRRDRLCRTDHPRGGRKPWSRRRMGRTAAGAAEFEDPAACFPSPWLQGFRSDRSAGRRVNRSGLRAWPRPRR